MSPSRKPETVAEFWREMLCDELAEYLETIGPSPAIRESWRRLYGAYLHAQYEMVRGMLDAVELQLKEVQQASKPARAKKSKARPRAKKAKKKKSRKVPVS